ncbi:MAG: knotted carbamoyltransferase YgeW [Bdellovibrionales bacterium RIFOXYD12_FULL_39_22]|nr:MAG: knotted carbamoyltransferase YgeW [Bdellovibrionales bacterium RIFOXYB1_FULL_39_21]OFZ43159.1 MAG: knotted carbamoyltransferase YgeW [Bdellovibrionales bacterium RIFOXYC12_FULL_39_17]OFZ47897.1 MAG: knotted carbamoyltransferase YgeW [Bdellovibrionales bacterium RIFOXYC1_FULL_39_130]OFZ73441.1 MAG: knotted carbamoyltransferase YgeW [Bdellovibrionales bacterium RIFOXYC2_FULL_39_8]OFZ75677.1 MAG: knotted carbamoyltransferase YgeW [Bdellovibrionales bacterium RIFOXYD1_FULL_39_84]OFZ94167.1
MSELNQLIENIELLKPSNLHKKDFLLTWEKSVDDLKQVLAVADALKFLHKHNINTRCFESGLAVSLFRDNSTRTRFSFASAVNLLGLEMQDLEEGKSQIAHGETVRETANMISFLTEVIGIRDDMFLGAGNRYMKEVGAALDDGFANGVLNQRPTVVNLQCDVDHPTQSMADLCWLQEHFGSLENLKGKKVAMTWAYSPSYGKPLSVPQGIIGLLTRFGMDVTLAHPEGYGLIPEVVDLAGKNAREGGGSFRVANTMEDAFKGADIVYPKSWAPYAVMGRRTELLSKQDHNGLKDLEKNCLAQNANFKNWECNEKMMKLTKNGNALYMHCLPADISGVSCKEGEVAASVFEKYRVATYKEAGYKPFVIASMILNSKFKDPAKLLSEFRSQNVNRVFA